MPILVWFYCDDDFSHFLGVCEFCKRDAFELKLKKLCEAMDWPWDRVRSRHGYIGSIPTNLEVI